MSRGVHVGNFKYTYNHINHLTSMDSVSSSDFLVKEDEKHEMLVKVGSQQYSDLKWIFRNYDVLDSDYNGMCIAVRKGMVHFSSNNFSCLNDKIKKAGKKRRDYVIFNVNTKSLVF